MMENLDFEKVKLVIENVPWTFLYNNNAFEAQSFLHTIVILIDHYRQEKIKTSFLTIAELLLKKQINPDGRSSIWQQIRFNIRSSTWRPSICTFIIRAWSKSFCKVHWGLLLWGLHQKLIWLSSRWTTRLAKNNVWWNSREQKN